MFFAFPNRTILRSKEVDCVGCNAGEWQEVFWYEPMDCTGFGQIYDAYIVYPVLAVAASTLLVLTSERAAKWFLLYLAVCAYTLLSAMFFIITRATFCATGKSIVATVYTIIGVPCNTLVVFLFLAGETGFPTLGVFYTILFLTTSVSVWLS